MGTSQLSLFENEPPSEKPGPPSKAPVKSKASPASLGRSPVFWIEEIRLLRTLSPKPRQEIRRIQLRRGMNIIWAPPLDGDDPDVRFSGHAAGKTSFCRLIRYLLGEAKCGSSFLYERLHARFPRGWVVARIWVDGKPWIVARPLTGRRRSLCNPSADIDAWLKDDPRKSGSEDFEVFRVTLHQATLEHLPVKSFGESGQSIRFLHLLAWLARDQECRLDGLLSWRHKDSQSANPPISSSDRRFLVRAVVGIIDQEIRREMEHRVSLEEDLRKLPAEVGFRQRTVEEAVEELSPFLDETHPNLADPLFAAGIETELTRAEERDLKSLRPPGALTIDEQRLALDQALQELGASEHAVRTWENDPCGVDASLAHKYCPFHVDTPDALPRQGGLTRKNRLPEYERQSAVARERVQSLQENYEEALREDEGQRRDREEIRNHYRVIREHLQRAIAAQTTLDALLEMRTQLKAEITASQERQESLQRRWDREASRFADLYRRTMQRLLGQGTDAECRFTRETIKLRASCNGDLNSAAINTLITLGFDLTALLASVEGYGYHPRFLIHDSPREADMDAHLYRRLFTHIQALEPEEGEADFQYIITSTEAPPAPLCREPWLRLRLDASKGEERLFCMDL